MAARTYPKALRQDECAAPIGRQSMVGELNTEVAVAIADHRLDDRSSQLTASFASVTWNLHHLK
jgi:hypothetical protein